MKTKKYTLQCRNEITVENTEVYLEDDQLEKIILNLGITFFQSEYTKDFYFIIATDEQVEKLKVMEFVEFVEEYNDTYFKSVYYTEIASDKLQELSDLRSKINFNQEDYDNKINEIEHIIEILRNERD